MPGGEGTKKIGHCLFDRPIISLTCFLSVRRGIWVPIPADQRKAVILIGRVDQYAILATSHALDLLKLWRRVPQIQITCSRVLWCRWYGWGLWGMHTSVQCPPFCKCRYHDPCVKLFPDDASGLVAKIKSVHHTAAWRVTVSSVRARTCHNAPGSRKYA